ncbi:MAG TPA: hypothetical protein VKU82_09820, partial [Planctomycetaceae bacterium]|nr:hypothetical protein [Planctomycetaceae bacterium]
KTPETNIPRFPMNEVQRAMPENKQRNWAAYCDTETRFFETEFDAALHAQNELEVCRREATDGWDEETTEGIAVMQVIARPTKMDPNVDYRCVEYSLERVGPKKPEWKDCPTSPGWWLCEFDDGHCKAVCVFNPADEPMDRRWFGPIPTDPMRQ